MAKEDTLCYYYEKEYKYSPEFENLFFSFLGESQPPENGDSGRKNMDALKINELEIENSRQREDLKRLRDSIANNNTDQIKEISDQFETLQEELDRR